jgi:DNA (cytosine-5)-methyltransferase 1
VADAAWLQPGREKQRTVGERVGMGGQPALADADGERGSGEASGRGALGEPPGSGRWESEPDVGRVAHGVPSRVDRLRALGNAVVPQIPEMIGRAILAAKAA